MMEDRMRRMEEFSLLSLDLHRGMETSRRQMEESQQHIQELLARMTQLVALIQADIVRLDETG